VDSQVAEVDMEGAEDTVEDLAEELADTE